MGNTTSEHKPEQKEIMMIVSRQTSSPNINMKNIKILLLGPEKSHKTKLLDCAFDNRIDHYQPTMGVDFHSKRIEISNKILKFQLWDTSSNLNYLHVLSYYFHEIDLIFLFYRQDQMHILETYLLSVSKFLTNKIIVLLSDVNSEFVSHPIDSVLFEKLNVNVKYHFTFDFTQPENLVQVLTMIESEFATN